MKNIWMLTAANLRKSKSQTVSLLIFVLIAAMFLNIGLVMYFGIGSFFDKRAEQNHAAHITAIYHSGADSIDAGFRFMENHPDVAEIEKLNVIGGFGAYSFGDVNSTSLLLISAVDAQQKMDTPSLVGDYLPLHGDAIYIPYFIMLGGDYQIGDDFNLLFEGISLSFTVAGGTEEIMFGAQMNGTQRFYVADEKLREIERMFPASGITLLSARFFDKDDAAFFLADFSREVSTEGLIFNFTHDIAKQSRTMVPLIAAMVVTAFSIILLTVSLIVIRFRIINNIEESMKNIGVLKAAGFRSIHIISSIVMQFGLTAFFGAFIGTALSLAVIPTIVTLFEPILALVWNPGFNPVLAAASILTVLLTILLISFISSRRINKLHPLIALRGGITTHSFKKNMISLDKARGNLSFLLALKQLLQSKKQAAAIVIIVTVVTMASVAGVAVSYNMNDGSDTFARSLFGEVPDAAFILQNSADGEAFRERLLEHPDVRKAFGYESSIPLLIDGTNILATAVEDTSLLEGNMLISGRYPIHSNEISLGPTILRVAGKGIGDTVMVKSGDIEKEFIVTGIVQFMQLNGFNGIITGEGLGAVRPDFQFASFYAYLSGDVDVVAFIDSVVEAEGNIFTSIVNFQEELETTMGSVGSIFRAVAIGIVAVTAFVVVLTLYMVIKAIILRQKRELGIKKALGFTTFQLMNQLAQSMAPIILLGVVAGAFAGFFGLNPMMIAIMSGMGIVQVALPVPLTETLIICAALVALAYLVSMLIAWRIRKISAYTLVIE